MRNILINFSYLFLLLVFLSGCGDKNDNPSPDTAIFRIDFTQNGDFEKFNKIITISGGDFYYIGTNKPVPAALIGDDANQLVFVAEGKNISELKISTLTGFSPVESGPAMMNMMFTVYKNGVMIDQKTFSYTEATRDKSEDLTYKAN